MRFDLYVLIIIIITMKYSISPDRCSLHIIMKFYDINVVRGKNMISVGSGPDRAGQDS